MDAILLDLDGTLIHSNDEHALAWMQALRENGHEVAFASVRRRIGMGGDQLLPSLLNLEASSPLGRRITERQREIFRAAYLPHLHAIEGAHALVERFRREGFSLAIATSANREEAEAALAQTKLIDLALPLVTSEENMASKPEPDILLRAMKRIGARAEKTRLIGDTPYDLIAAQRAGIRFVAFTSGGWSPQDFYEAEAVFDGPLELLRAFPLSPFGHRAPIARSA